MAQSEEHRAFCEGAGAALTHKGLSSKAVSIATGLQYIPQLPEWRACLRTVSTPSVQSKTHLLIF